MNEEHPFAQYIRMLGKGKSGSRSLTMDEAKQAMSMILKGEAEPMQLGAFLMLMRLKEETPEELAGFVMAARESLSLPEDMPTVQVDWSSYAGKRRQLPWFVLSALLLASHGISVFLHAASANDGRIYTPQILESMGITSCRDLTEAATRIRAQHFAFMSLEHLSPTLQYLMTLRPILGLRSPANTLVRMINPMHAPLAIQGIFHPGYRDLHQLAALKLEQPHLVVLKGEGGESERDPDSACLVKSVHDGQLSEEEWPAMFANRHIKDERMDTSRLPALWKGEIEDEYALAAVTGTAAIVLKAMGKADNRESAQTLAMDMWRRRSTMWPGVH